MTICAWKRQCAFGDIIDGKPQLCPFGEIVLAEWLRTSQIRPAIMVDAFVVMPNHLHGILIITDYEGRVQRATTEAFGKPVSNSISTIVRLFKSTVTKRVNELRRTPDAPVWQRNYYEHIIRDERELKLVREYIVNSPLQWDLDRENPIRSGETGKSTSTDDKPWLI